jgi:N-acetylated-alpha-linked acidic dipeptidase
LAFSLSLSLAASPAVLAQLVPVVPGSQPPRLFGYADPTEQLKLDKAFMAVPDAKLAGEHLKALTAEPHWASSPEDYKTAQYVAEKFKAAGLQTEIVPFRVWLNKPVKIEISAVDAAGKKLMQGPTPEHVDAKAYGGDPFQDDKRVLPAFNGSSASGDVTAGVVYANYGTLEDFAKLEQLGVSVKGKIVIVRYGQNFRGIKVQLAQQRGAVGVIIYSDPADDGYVKGDMYPRGAWRPSNAVQRGSVQFLSTYPGDPQTPGVASTPELPDSQRVTDVTKMNQPSIPANPLSYEDAAPILQAMDGLASPREWQGGLPFTYHVGGGSAVKVHMNLVQDYKLRTIWDVIGTIPGEDTAAWVVAGNHRDAWVYGAVDPNSGTAAMLETVHGLGELLKQGWKPKRTIVIGSWDAEEEGLMGSTEWVEMHAKDLSHAVAYFNMDEGVAGPNFTASAVPSLMAFLREVTMQVESPKGGSVFDQWLKQQTEERKTKPAGRPEPMPTNPADTEIGMLGSGSDFTPFLQHLGVPATDVASDGPYGVYHSVFDNYNWFVKNADPTFAYEQQQARVFGLEVLHMADADVLPYDYRYYGHVIEAYLNAAENRAHDKGLKLSFEPANQACRALTFSGERIYVLQTRAIARVPLAEFNEALHKADGAFLSDAGLPHRPWYKHLVFAPGEYTGYAAVVLPGVTEAVEDGDGARAQEQLDLLTAALKRATDTLDSAVQKAMQAAAAPRAPAKP